MPSPYAGHFDISRPNPNKSDGWHKYTCAHCGLVTAGAVLVSKGDQFSGVLWLECIHCGGGSICHFPEKIYFPAPAFGPIIGGLPPKVKDAYTEARNDMSVNSLISCELICRNILMYVAVDKGAKTGNSFVGYIDYLVDQGYVTPPMHSWVDLIRQHGNKAAHELDPPDRKRTESTLLFTAALLNLVYGMDHLAKQFVPHNDKQEGE